MIDLGNTMTLMNPYAYVGDELVTAADVKDREMDFRCPNCNESLILKKGEIRTAHFAHKPNVPECDPDLVTHKIAIDMICSGKEFKWTFHCRNHASELDIYYEYGLFFKKGDNTECEYSYSRTFGGNNYLFEKEYKISKYYADIAVFFNGELKGVIEVCNTHKNEPEKVSYYKDNKILYIEVDACSVIDAYKRNIHVTILNSNLSDLLSCDVCIKTKRVMLLMNMNNSLPWLSKYEFKKRTRENFNRVFRLTDDEVLLRMDKA